MALTFTVMKREMGGVFYVGWGTVRDLEYKEFSFKYVKFEVTINHQNGDRQKDSWIQESDRSCHTISRKS